MEICIQRIKTRIKSINNVLNSGAISMIINFSLSWMVTLEINNGKEKITIKQIITELKNKLQKLNTLLDELVLTDEINETEGIETSLKSFKQQVYKLFSITDVINLLVAKCVSFGYGINKIINMFSKKINIVSDRLIDDIFFMHKDTEYTDYIDSLIDERFEHLVDPIEKKILKINMLHDMLAKYADISLELNIRNIDP